MLWDILFVATGIVDWCLAGSSVTHPSYDQELAGGV